MMRRTRLVGLVIALLAMACSGEDAPVETGAGDDAGDVPSGEAWARVGYVEGTLPDRAAAAVVEDADAWGEAWTEYGFSGARPDVDFDTHVVLLLGQAGNGCVDELVGLDVDDEKLEVEWQAPDRMCTQQLVLRIHAVAVHRRQLAIEFTYGLSEPFEAELEPVTIELPAAPG